MKKIVLGIGILFLSNHILWSMEKTEEGKKEQSKEQSKVDKSDFVMGGENIPYDVVKKIPLIYPLYEGEMRIAELPDQFPIKAFKDLIEFIKNNKTLFPDYQDESGEQKVQSEVQKELEGGDVYIEKFAAQRTLIECFHILNLLDYLGFDEKVIAAFIPCIFYTKYCEISSDQENFCRNVSNQISEVCNLDDVVKIFKKENNNQLHYSSKISLKGSGWIIASSTDDNTLFLIEKNVGSNHNIYLIKKTFGGWVNVDSATLPADIFDPIGVRITAYQDEKGVERRWAVVLCDHKLENKRYIFKFSLPGLMTKRVFLCEKSSSISNDQFDVREGKLIVVCDGHSDQSALPSPNIKTVIYDLKTEKMLKEDERNAGTHQIKKVRFVGDKSSIEISGMKLLNKRATPWFDVSQDRSIIFLLYGQSLFSCDATNFLERNANSRMMRKSNAAPESIQSIDGKNFLLVEKAGFFTSRKETMHYADKSSRRLPILLYPVVMLSDGGVAGVYNGNLIFLDSTTSLYNMAISNIARKKKTLSQLQEKIDKEIVEKTQMSWWDRIKQIAVPTTVVAAGAFALYKGVQWLKNSPKQIPFKQTKSLVSSILRKRATGSHSIGP